MEEDEDDKVSKDGEMMMRMERMTRMTIGWQLTMMTGRMGRQKKVSDDCVDNN